jgi:high-affinity iron transporter
VGRSDPNEVAGNPTPSVGFTRRAAPVRHPEGGSRTIGAALLITLREGLEAALIISILLAYLRKLGRPEGVRPVWGGAALALVLSVAVGAVVFGLGAEFAGTGEQLFEGLVSLLAVSLLTWMIFWMRRQGRRLKSELEGRVDSALSAGGVALGTVAFATVAREGIETSLFVFAAARGTAVGSGGIGEQVLGAILGLLIASALGALLYRGAIKLNLATFFRWTGALVLIVAAGLFAFSIHELQEAGVLPFLTGTAFDISASFSDQHGLGGILRALIGYQSDPTVLEVIAWFGYLVVTGALFLRPAPAPRPLARETTATR